MTRPFPAQIVLGSLGAAALLPAEMQSRQPCCVLLPAIDSSNHRGSGAACEIHLDPLRNAFVMQATRAIARGEEVKLKYRCCDPRPRVVIHCDMRLIRDSI